MNSLLKRCSTLAVMGLLLASTVAFAQSRAFDATPVVATPTLDAEQQRTLAAAADDAQLPTWQRDIMRDLAQGGGLDASAPAASLEPGTIVPNADDGTWTLLKPAEMQLRRAPGMAYDPVRQRVLVIGGEGDNCFDDVWELALGGSPVWTQLFPTGISPGPLARQWVFYDPVRDRMLSLFGYGGATNWNHNEVYALSMTDPPAWTMLTPTGTPPDPRSTVQAIYDPARDRVVVFGGENASPMGDLWELTLAGTPAWSPLAAAGTASRARASGSAIYDPIRDRMLIFGGFAFASSGAGELLNDVVSLSLAGTPTWSTLTPAGTPPSPRIDHASIYDPIHDRMLIAGGNSTTESNLADVWALSLGEAPAWSNVSPTGSAPGRAQAGAVYDPVAARMVIATGSTGSPSSYGTNDAWALELSDPLAWSQLVPGLQPSVPAGRWGHTMIYDPVRDRIVVFGGQTSTTVYLNETWVLPLSGTLAAWTRLYPAGSPPLPMTEHTAIYDPVRDRMIVYDGLYWNEVYALSFSGTPTWTPIIATGTRPNWRKHHVAIYDPVRDRMVICGGYGVDSRYYYPDTWALSLGVTPTWTNLTPTGTPPPAAYDQSAIYDPIRDRMLVTSPNAQISAHSTYALSLGGTPTWTLIQPTGTPPPARAEASAVYDPDLDRMLVYFGKFSGDRPWSLSLAGSPAVKVLSPSGQEPPHRIEYSIVWDSVRKRMILFGGNNGRALNDVRMLWNPSTLGVGGGASSGVAGLRAPVPNPASGASTIGYALARPGRVHIAVYDVAGRLVRTLLDREQAAGNGSVTWNGASASGANMDAGVYFVLLTTPGLASTRRVVRLR